MLKNILHRPRLFMPSLVILISFVLTLPQAADAKLNPGDHFIKTQTGYWESETLYHIAGTSSGFAPSTTLLFKAFNHNSQEEFVLGIVDHHYDWEDCQSRAIQTCPNSNWWVTLEVSNLQPGNYHIVVTETSMFGIEDYYPEDSSTAPDCNEDICIKGT